MLFVRALAYALLAHELLYLCRDGRGFLTRTFLPVFGLRLSPRAHAAAHLLLIGLCTVLVVRPELWVLYPLLLVSLTIVIASYSLRLSNHLVLGWFMTVALVCSIASQPAAERGVVAAPLLVSSVRGLMIATWALAFLHKLNRDYLSLEQSCAVQWADFFCLDRGVRNPAAVRGIRLMHLWGGMVLEASLPLLMWFPATAGIGFLLALSFHFAIALLGIVNFSAMMYAGLVMWLPASITADLPAFIAGIDPWWPIAAAAGSLAAVVLLTPRRANFDLPYRHRNLAWAFQVTFGLATALLLVCGVASVARGLRMTTLTLSTSEAATAAVLAGAFVLNGLAPYFGTKTEFSLAMFSNLRDTPWRHLVVPDRWRPWKTARYVRLASVDGLPTPHDEDSALIVHLLSQRDRYLYSPYFVSEAMKRLGGGIRLSVRGESGEVSFDEWERRRNAIERLPIVLFPFALPVDAEARHSEQGSVVENGKQLF